MRNRFFDQTTTQKFSIESLTNAYRHYKQQYDLKKKNETTDEMLEKAWLSIGAEQAKLPAAILNKFCKDGRAFSFAQHGFIQITPLSPNHELGSKFTLVHIKGNQDLPPFAREARGIDISKYIKDKDALSNESLYVDPANTNADADYLIDLCKQYNEKNESPKLSY